MQTRWTLTKADLDSVPDTALVQKVINSVLEFIAGRDPEEDDYELVRQAPRSAQFFWAMRLLESEVNNGGFEQYFWNSSCRLADVASDAYQAIGAEKYVNFLKKGSALAGDVTWEDRRRRFGGEWKAYKKACIPEWDDLDEEFYQANCGDPDSGGGDHDLYKRKVNYIRENASTIAKS
jgi:hypothetical protein